MKYAQRCKACKELFVVPERVESCPSCAAPMPKPKAKQSAGITPEFIVKARDICAGLTWQQWRDSEPGLHEDEKSCGAVSDVAGPSVTEGASSDVASSDVIAEFLQINEEIASLYNLLYGFMSKNTELIKAPRHSGTAGNVAGNDNGNGKGMGVGNAGMSNEDMCDFGFFCREAENTLDELRKEVKARKELCGQVIALRKTQDSLSDPNIKLKVTGQYATGSPDVKMQAQLPKKFTDDYYKITDFFKVPREVASTGVLRIDWKASGDFLTQLAADGHKPPDGFGKQYPTYVTTFRRRRMK